MPLLLRPCSTNKPICRHPTTLIRERIPEQAGLQLHPTKTGITTPGEDFDFLGYHFLKGKRMYRFPGKKALRKLKDAIRGKTRRTDGRSLEAIIADGNHPACGASGVLSIRVAERAGD